MLNNAEGIGSSIELMSESTRKFLILEDTELLSKMVAETLRAAFPGALVCTAATIAEARALAAEHHFELMILDVHLPDGNGPEFLMEVQRANPDVKSVFLTASPLPAHQEQARALGAVAFLRKPTRMSKLRKV